MPGLGECITAVSNFLKQIGFVRGALFLFICYLLWKNDRNFNKRIEEKQDQINRLAQENREYREIFVQRYDIKMKKRGK